MTLAAMNFARTAHANDPWRLSMAAETAGIVATLPAHYYLPLATHREVIATAWLQGITDLPRIFGPAVAGGVRLLSEREMMPDAPSWVQTIKVAAVIAFLGRCVPTAKYSANTRELLDAMTGAHPDLLAIAREALKCS